MRKNVQSIKIDSIKELKNPNFIKPIELNYTINGKKRVWEAVIAYDSVAILVWNEEKHCFILVKQFRAPVLNANNTDGMMYELCAGLVDKNASNIQIAKEEVLEECGYDIPLQNIEKITSCYTSVGISGTQQTFYYAKCNESMKVNEGGGLAEEDIEVIYLPLDDAKKFMFNDSYQKTPGLIMAFYWFFDNIKNQ